MNDRRNSWRGVAGWGLALFVGLGGAACDLDENEPPVAEPDTQLHMASIGNSLTAGFQSSGINLLGQQASFANLVSMTIAGRPLQSPLVALPGIGSTPGLTPLFIDEGGNLTAEPLPGPAIDLTLNLRYPIPYDNLGVPGATTEEMLNRLEATAGPDWGTNPFFDLILRNAALPGGGTVIEQVERLRPDIITLWTGNNEVLGGATSGSPQNTDPSAPGYVYPAGIFDDFFVDMCDRIDALEPQMVAVANVPPVTAVPFTRFWKLTPPTSPIRWNMVEDCDDAPPGTCDPEGFDDQIDSDPAAFVLLPAGSQIAECIQCLLPICNASNPCDAIPAHHTLSVSEAALINDSIAAYNAIILREATARGWAHVDINSEFLSLPTAEDTEPLNTAFPWNLLDPHQNETSAFTLDGVHPSEKGHGRIANAFLDAINDEYETNYPMYDLTTIENVAGFQRAPDTSGGRLSEPGGMTADAGASLEGLVRMLSPRF